MKLVKFAAIALVAMVAFSACSNLEKTLTKKGGQWVMSSSAVKTYQGDSLVSDTTYTNTGWVEFMDDGTGTTYDYNTDTVTGTFTWTADNDAETISITQDSVTSTMDVLESSKDQITTYSETTFEIIGITFKIESTGTMDRK